MSSSPQKQIKSLDETKILNRAQILGKEEKDLEAMEKQEQLRQKEKPKRRFFF